MSFLKTGTPQPMTIMGDMCEICGQNKAEFIVDGKSVCSQCKEKMSKSIQN